MMYKKRNCVVCTLDNNWIQSWPTSMI